MNRAHSLLTHHTQHWTSTQQALYPHTADSQSPGPAHRLIWSPIYKHTLPGQYNWHTQFRVLTSAPGSPGNPGDPGLPESPSGP